MLTWVLQAYGGDAWSRAPPSNSDGYNQHNNHHQHHRLNEHPSTGVLAMDSFVLFKRIRHDNRCKHDSPDVNDICMLIFLN